jgi:hypothetical protein
MHKYLVPLFVILVGACGSVSEENGPDAADSPTPDADPSVPQVTASTDQVDTIRVGWTTVADATRYVVLRAEAETGPYDMVADSSATTYDEVRLAASDVKYFKVQACTASGCGAESAAARGHTIPGTVTLSGCSRGTLAAAVSCTWTVASGETDGTVSYSIWAHVAGAEPEMVATSTATTADAPVPAGDLYSLAVRVENSETGSGALSGEALGYAESVVIVHGDTAADLANAQALETILETDLVGTPGVGGTMPTLPAVVVSQTLVSNTYSTANTWTGRPMIITSNMGASDAGRVRNLVSSTGRNVIGMGRGTQTLETINANGGSWGIGGLPTSLGSSVSGGSIQDEVRTFLTEGDVFTAPLYATAYGTSPANGVAEPYASSGVNNWALNAPNPIAGVQRLCMSESASNSYFPCAQQGRWGQFGYYTAPDQLPGRILFINFVYRFTL